MFSNITLYLYIPNSEVQIPMDIGGNMKTDKRIKHLLPGCYQYNTNFD